MIYPKRGFTPLEIFAVLKRRVRSIPQLFSMSSGSPRSASLTGFTLIELIVVISIIGILSAIVLVSLNSARSRARDTKRITDIKQIQVALELYFDGTGNGQYPPESITCSAAVQYGLETLVTLNYMPVMPRDPKSTGDTSGCYIYNAADSGNRTTYHLGTALENTTSSVLTNDKDLAAGALGVNNNFSGLSSAASPGPCTATVGTELCFDVVP